MEPFPSRSLGTRVNEGQRGSVCTSLFVVEVQPAGYHPSQRCSFESYSVMRCLLMPISVELFGIARSRAGIGQTMAEGDCLGDVLVDLASRFPGLATACVEGRKFRPGFTANLNGRQFVTSPETPLTDDDTVLILSLDAGG